VLGHRFIEEVDTSALDLLKTRLPTHLAPSSINHRLSLVRTILRFMWKRGLLASVPYVPMESVPTTEPVWYGNKERPALLGTRKNYRSLKLSLTQDMVDGTFPRHPDSHKRPLRAVQRALGLRELSHHQIGRHLVASQAATSRHSIKAIQAQLGHQSAQSTHLYAHLGDQAQLRLVEALRPVAPPHVNVRSTAPDRQNR